MRIFPRDLRPAVVRAIAVPAARWRNLPLTVQLMLLAVTIVVGWMLGTRAYERVVATPRDVQSRTAHWQHAEILAGRAGATAYELEVAARAYAMTGDSVRLRESHNAERRYAALLDSLDAVGAGDPDMLGHIVMYRELASRWRAALKASAGAGQGGGAKSPHLSRERVLFDSTRSLETALREEMRGRQHTAHAEAEARIASRESFLLRVGPIVTALILFGISGLLMRRTLLAVSEAARALAEGRYGDVRVPAELGGNREMRKIADTFEELALAIEEREQILQSDILQLREYEQLKSDFVSTVSHELRTPLTSMRGALGLVISGAAGPLSAEGRDLLQIANQNTERLIRLINDILDIEKIESGTITVRHDRCDLRSVLEATIAGVQGYAVEQDVGVALRAPRTADVTGDHDRLIQVFTNLLSNAIKFSPKGGEVRVALEIERDVARVSVRDTGPGIPAEFQARIFGKFQQAESSASRRHGGTGLGLAIARAIVERHDGRIHFRTAPGEGTTFVVELPCAPAPRVSAPDIASTAPHVLVVDADPDIVRILQTLAGSLAVLIGAATPDEALHVARGAALDAVILEPEVADGSGLDLVYQLRSLRRYSELPVIVFSAREYAPGELEGVTLSAAHAYVKARDREEDVMMRLRAVLAARVKQ